MVLKLSQTVLFPLLANFGRDRYSKPDGPIDREIFHGLPVDSSPPGAPMIFVPGKSR